MPLPVVLIPDENRINPSLQEIVLRGDAPALYDFSMPQSMLAGMFDRAVI